MTTLFQFNYPMGPSHGVAFEKIEGKCNTWYVADIPNKGDEIYCDTKNPQSDGFGGATLKFKLKDGTVEEVIGPWHSNSQALFADTGVDYTNHHYIRYIIAKEMEGDFYKGVLCKDVLQVCDVPVLGKFDCSKEIAQQFANELGCKVRVARQSSGGSSIGWAEPKEK